MNPAAVMALTEKTAREQSAAGRRAELLLHVAVYRAACARYRGAVLHERTRGRRNDIRLGARFDREAAIDWFNGQGFWRLLAALEAERDSLMRGLGIPETGDSWLAGRLALVQHRPVRETVPSDDLYAAPAEVTRTERWVYPAHARVLEVLEVALAVYADTGEGY